MKSRSLGKLRRRSHDWKRHGRCFFRKKQIERCESLKENEICFIECEEEHYYVTPFPFTEEDWKRLFMHVKDIWGIEQCRMGISSYLSVEKAASGEFEQYDGFFTQAWGGVDRICL